MGWTRTFVVAALTGAVGLAAGGFAASLTADWYDFHAFEGADGLIVALFAIVALITGVVIGLIVSRLVSATGEPRVRRALAMSSTVLVALITAVTVAARVLAHIPPEIGGEQLFLMVEVRASPGYAAPAGLPGVGYLKLGSSVLTATVASETGPLFKEDARLEDGRWVVPGAVRVFTSRGARTLGAWIGGTTLGQFPLPLRAQPGPESLNWTDWVPAASGTSSSDRVAARYKVVRQSEPLRIERFGRLTIATTVSALHRVRWSEMIAATSDFHVTYDGRPIAGSPFGAIAVVPGPRPVLLVRGHGIGSTPPCQLLIDTDDGLDRRPFGGCSPTIAGQPLTSDHARFVAARDKDLVFGWVDRLTFASPGLFLVHDNVFDTTTLDVTRVAFPSDLAPSGNPPPLGLSPDRRSFVWFAHTASQTEQPTLAVTDWTTGRSYTLPIDRDRMRFVGFETIDPDWLAHHFRWRRASDGVDVLEERPDYQPLKYRTYLTLRKRGDHQQYWLFPGGEPLRREAARILVDRFQGTQLSDDTRSNAIRIRLNGKTVQVSANVPGLVSVWMRTGEGDPEVIKQAGAHLDAAMASGKYDALFFPAPPR